MGITAQRKAELDKLCAQFRKDVLTQLHAIQTGHPGGSLSVCEILTALYFEKVKVDGKHPDDPNRDRVILCKGHAAPMLYRILAEKGFFPLEDMKTLRQVGSHLQGHPCALHTPGVEACTGPLGVGYPMALGVALGNRLSGISSQVYAILGDGELNEGIVWEAMMSASKFKADNLTAIVDWNRVQLDGTTDEVMPMPNMEERFRSFGFHVIVCDGHNISALCDAIDEAKSVKGAPSVILAKTVKGKGVSFMEGKNVWHGKPIGDDDIKQALAELGGVS